MKLKEGDFRVRKSPSFLVLHDLSSATFARESRAIFRAPSVLGLFRLNRLGDRLRRANQRCLVLRQERLELGRLDTG